MRSGAVANGGEVRPRLGSDGVDSSRNAVVSALNLALQGSQSHVQLLLLSQLTRV